RRSRTLGWLGIPGRYHGEGVEAKASFRVASRPAAHGLRSDFSPMHPVAYPWLSLEAVSRIGGTPAGCPEGDCNLRGSGMFWFLSSGSAASPCGRVITPHGSGRGL